MSELFRTLTTSCVEGEPVSCCYMVPGYVRHLSRDTALYLGADRICDDEKERYEPSITMFSKGKPVEPMAEGYCFDLSHRIGFIVCVRGMRVDVDNKPVRFLVEIYKRQKQKRHLRVVA
ncbi:MAG: hypothetical protein OQK69_10715 [Gammaproteobacteria bacterium]|nr:hypothetical protein [Gammaproteobacteria bacterium]